MDSSKIRTAAPSASTIPARSRLNGGQAVAGFSLSEASRPTEANEANTRGIIGVSDAPATAMLKSPFRISRNASPIAEVPDGVHANHVDTGRERYT